MAQLEDSLEEDVDCDALRGLLTARAYTEQWHRGHRVVQTLAVSVALTAIALVVAFRSDGFSVPVLWQGSAAARVDISKLSEEKETLYSSPHGGEMATPINDIAIRPASLALHDFSTPAPTSYSMQEPMAATPAAGVGNAVGQQGNPHLVGNSQRPPSFSIPRQQDGQQPIDHSTRSHLPSNPKPQGGSPPFGWQSPSNRAQQRGPQPLSNPLQLPMLSNSGGAHTDLQRGPQPLSNSLQSPVLSNSGGLHTKEQKGPQPFSNSLQSPLPSNSGGSKPPAYSQPAPFPSQGGKSNTASAAKPAASAHLGQVRGQQPLASSRLPPFPSQGGEAKTLMAGQTFAPANSGQQTGPQKTLMAAKALAAAAKRHPHRAPQQGAATAGWAPTQQTAAWGTMTSGKAGAAALPATAAAHKSHGAAFPSAFPAVASFPPSASTAVAASVSKPPSSVTTRQKPHQKPDHGQLEFNSKGGPRTIAGTKVMKAGIEDLSDNDNLTHVPAEAPPLEYRMQNPPMQMYMYRAQSDSNYPMRNVNTADLAGVMWYLHNEIVGFPDLQYKIRHFNITRIVRLLVTLQNPSDFFQEHKERFAPFVSFGAGKCNVPHCDSIWKKYGALVGCQAADKKVANYESQWKTQPPEAQCGDCNSPLWFSLPGPCPAHEYGAKSADCISSFPGGDCGKHPVTGAKDCTYSAKWYGEIRLDELINVTFSDGTRGSFADFLKAGGKEYDKATDKGVYTAFWDGILDKASNDRRMQTVRWLFSQKYPGYPTELQETSILCDFGGWHAGEFANDGLPVPGVE